MFNKPNSLSQGSNTVSIAYGPNRERIRRIEVNAGVSTTTHYVGSYEKIWRPSGVNETRRYLDGEVIVTTRSNGTQDVEYLFTDQLGSTDVITNDAGVIVQSMAFDAFGKRREPINYAAMSQAAISSFDTTHTTKGFTGHEEMDPVGLVHMNGRVYEPRLGRFLSADPFVQDPTDTQSLNRHSYGFNNALSGTDPSGYVFGIDDAIIKVVEDSIYRYLGDQVRKSIVQATTNTNQGAVPGVFANGSPSLPSSVPGCTSGNGCIMNIGEDRGVETGDATIAILNRGNGSEQTGGNFGNGSTTGTYAVLIDIGVSLVPGVDLYRCGTLRNCGGVDWTLAVVGVLPIAKPFVAAAKVARVAEAAATAARNERKIEEALEVEKTIAAARRVPNPHGRAGGPAHQAKVAEVEADIRSRGLDPVRESRVPTPNGAKSSRYVDVAARDPRTGEMVERHQVGRQTKGGQPVARERQAMDDIESTGVPRPTYHPYD